MFQKEVPTFEITVNGEVEEINPNYDLKICDGEGLERVCFFTKFAHKGSF